MSGPEREGGASGGAAPASVVEGDHPVAPASPDGFRLEAEVPRVMRLSRRTLAIGAGTAGLAIGGALLWALQAPAPRAPDELYDPAAPNRADALEAAPADYGAFPKLGPPLPGDLGRPIVAARKEQKGLPPGAPSVPPPDPREAERAQARERAAREREAAIASRLFLGGGSAGRAVAVAAGDVAPPPKAAAPREGTAAARRHFLADGRYDAVESAERIAPPSSTRIIQAGSVIPAALLTAVRSDLPGQITAQVTQNVYDSPTGRILLIPQGARLVGEYDSEIAAGQTRLLLAWDRLILPGGRSLRLDRLPGADAAGAAGLEDRVDNHWGRMLRGALVSSLLGVGTELAADGDDVLVRALRGGVEDSAGETGRRVVERELGVPPTLTIRVGHVFRVMVTRDLILEEAK